MSAEFRIVHRRYFNAKGVVTMQHWRVEQWTKGVFYSAWEPLGSGTWPTEFDSLDDARECIERIQNKTPISQWVAETVADDLPIG